MNQMIEVSYNVHMGLPNECSCIINMQIDISVALKVWGRSLMVMEIDKIHFTKPAIFDWF